MILNFSDRATILGFCKKVINFFVKCVRVLNGMLFLAAKRLPHAPKLSLSEMSKRLIRTVVTNAQKSCSTQLFHPKKSLFSFPFCE